MRVLLTAGFAIAWSFRFEFDHVYFDWPNVLIMSVTFGASSAATMALAHQVRRSVPLNRTIIDVASAALTPGLIALALDPLFRVFWILAFVLSIPVGIVLAWGVTITLALIPPRSPHNSTLGAATPPPTP